ncbi:hypothetical protein [Sphingomonas gellani]|uniref:hypothetical protein n=1 Tax=Sphingomonas gellani TaxID=1166340 RepID=UPI00111397CD|nr:hypothetical protein [Sphingomonas gellani]
MELRLAISYGLLAGLAAGMLIGMLVSGVSQQAGEALRAACAASRRMKLCRCSVAAPPDQSRTLVVHAAGLCTDEAILDCLDSRTGA